MTMVVTPPCDVVDCSVVAVGSRTVAEIHIEAVNACGPDEAAFTSAARSKLKHCHVTLWMPDR
jgi:hypothetical protein